MLVKTRIDEKGTQLYAVCVVGKNGVKSYSDENILSAFRLLPSQRKEKRHPVLVPHANNRKPTRGRIVQHTDIGVINHVSEYRTNSMKMVVANRFGVK